MGAFEKVLQVHNMALGKVLALKVIFTCLLKRRETMGSIVHDEPVGVHWYGYRGAQKLLPSVRTILYSTHLPSLNRLPLRRTSHLTHQSDSWPCCMLLWMHALVPYIRWSRCCSTARGSKETNHDCLSDSSTSSVHVIICSCITPVAVMTLVRVPLVLRSAMMSLYADQNSPSIGVEQECSSSMKFCGGWSVILFSWAVSREWWTVSPKNM